MLYDYSDLTDLQNNGLQVDKDGIYTIWIRGRGGGSIHLSVAGQALDTTHTQGQETPFWTWERAGQVRLEAQRPSPIHLQALQGLGGGEHPPVAGLALSRDRAFDPRRSWEVSRVLHDQVGPVADARLLRWRHVNAPWTLASYSSKAAWEVRAAHIRRHILVTLGLWPLPERPPLKAHIDGWVERPGYRVARVYFESLPGFFVCGNLYRPLGSGPFPAIACPHGHWGRGRLEDSPAGSIPGRCINLARQGHVAFSYDMAGYLDSDQVRHREYRGPELDLWGIGLMGLQLWNSMRVVDFLCSLEEVDASRIGCTGASGGGTQTFMLTAVDDRIRAAAPVNMVSTHMQGGCNCENQGHLRLDINNVEIVAAMAPKPLLLVSATGDWTVHTPYIEYPAVRRLYRLFGAEDRVSTHQVDAPHNYNKESREAVYAFFGRWFLDDDDPKHFREQDFTVEEDQVLRVFQPSRPRPVHALDEAGLTAALIERARRGIERQRPGNAEGLRRFKQGMTQALGHALGAALPAPEEIEVQALVCVRRADAIVQRLLLGRAGLGEQVPALFFSPTPGQAPGPGVIVVHGGGKAGLADMRRGAPGPLVLDLLQRGMRVLTLDPFLTGEFHGPFGPNQRPNIGRHATTYNQSTAACRVQDILTGMAYLLQLEEIEDTRLLGVEGAGLWCLLAAAVAGGVGRTAVDFNRFAVDDDQAWVRDCFVPAIRSAGDIRTAVGLVAPAPLLIHQIGTQFPTDWARDIYAAGAAPQALRLERRRIKSGDIAAWISAG
ncbi:MAG: hypothetical protein GKR89_12160 [Candidatus Latescibacteria bacterium]|nr:hypothetical protein [Candidatus Latescibacterota bacterium]